MKELIERLERATGPNREIDLAISVAINFKGVFESDRDWRWNVMGDEIEGHRNGKRSGFLDPTQFVPRWTASIDSAMQLVQENNFAEVCTDPVCATIGVKGNPGYIAAGLYQVGGATPAIALCIAALRARSRP